AGSKRPSVFERWPVYHAAPSGATAGSWGWLSLPGTAHSSMCRAAGAPAPAAVLRHKMRAGTRSERMSDLRAGARKPRTRPALLGAWALAAAATAGSAFEGGPLPGFTGGFAEPTCAKCHFDQAPNDPAGSLRLSGLPRSYTPGARYVITILLQHPNL